MCGGRFSGVTHPYTYKPYTLYRCGCVGSEYTYIVNVIYTPLYNEHTYTPLYKR